MRVPRGRYQRRSRKGRGSFALLQPLNDNYLRDRWIPWARKGVQTPLARAAAGSGSECVSSGVDTGEAAERASHGIGTVPCTQAATGREHWVRVPVVDTDDAPGRRYRPLALNQQQEVKPNEHAEGSVQTTLSEGDTGPTDLSNDKL